jgi:hypothetical protein
MSLGDARYWRPRTVFRSGLAVVLMASETCFRIGFPCDLNCGGIESAYAFAGRVDRDLQRGGTQDGPAAFHVTVEGCPERFEVAYA